MPPAAHAPFILSTPAILVGAAPTDLAGIEHCIPEWPVFAADGGVHTALANRLSPRAVIGDMDSVAVLDQLDPAIERIHQTGQNDTDFEKCLNLIHAPLIIGFGFLGARHDHTLAALHTLASLTDSRPIILVGPDDVMVRVHGDCQFYLPIGTRFSLWPLGRQNFIQSQGLAWPVDGLTMEIGKQGGTSNRVTATNVKLKVGPGDGYMVILPADCLRPLLTVALHLANLS
jgi:thiamine pyrophosphokinase